MWLRYGVDPNNLLVAIEKVKGGSTNLICPYCSSNLVAKKGKVKQHHFAHNGETCRMVVKRKPRDLPTLPLYDAFDIFLTGKQFEQLKNLWHRHKSHNNGIHRLEILPAFVREQLLEYHQQPTIADSCGTYHFTDLGLIPVAALSLNRFNSVQEPLILQKLSQLEAAVFDAKGVSLPEQQLLFRLTDWRIYCAQLRKILLSTLYYLKVEADGQAFYKIGITTRAIAQRVVEVKRDLRSHFKEVTIEVLGTWARRGNVEKYFKYRYSDSNYPIGSLTEYFRFNNPANAQAVMHDLQQMKPKVLSPVEEDVVAGKLTSMARVLGTETKLLERSLSPTQQTQTAQLDDADSDRLSETELERIFLSNSSSVRVIEALHQGNSLRRAAEITSVPIEQVRNILTVMQKYQ